MLQIRFSKIRLLLIRLKTWQMPYQRRNKPLQPQTPINKRLRLWLSNRHYCSKQPPTTPHLRPQIAAAAAQAQNAANSGYDFIKGKSAKADIVAKFGNPTNVAQNGGIETWTYTYQSAAESAQAAVGVAKGLLSVASSFLPFGAQASQATAIANDVANVAGKMASNAASTPAPYKSAVFVFSQNGILSDYSIVK